MDSNQPIDFGPFRLDPASGLLLKDGAPVPLTPKAFGVLHHLAARADRLVSKQELLDAIWPKVFVGDAVLKVTIGEIRRALGDDPKAPKYIATAHRRGYRFTAARSADVGTSGAPATQVKYARSGSVNIAYQVVGSGPIDLVFVMGWVSHLEYFWREPAFAAFLTRLASMARLILFDKRGTGTLGSCACQAAAHARRAAGRCARSDGRGGFRARGAVGCLRRRAAVHVVRGNLS